MKKSSSSNLKLREASAVYRTGLDPTDLEFPVDAGFNSRPPRLSSAEYVKWCETMRATLPKKREPEAKVKLWTGEEFNL